MALVDAANLDPLSNLASPYNLFDLKKKNFFVLNKREKGFASYEQSHHLLHAKGAVNSGLM